MTSVSSEHVSWKAGLAFFVICLAFVGTILAIGFQNIAAATPEQVNFNPVTIRNGAKIHVNGDKSLTAIDNGNKLVADNTNGTPVKGDQIESELNSFAATNYSNDALFKSSTANNPASLSEAEVNAFRQYLPTVDNEYWLSDIGSLGSISWQGYANSDNSLNKNSLQATGKIDDFEFDETEVVSGSYEFNTDVTPRNFTASAGGIWDLNYLKDKKTDFRVFYAGEHWLSNGTVIYNNPFCISDTGSYVSSTVQNLDIWSTNKIYAYVVEGNRIVQAKVGQTLSAGTVVLVGLVKGRNQIVNPSGFQIARFTYTLVTPDLYIGFVKMDSDLTVVACSDDVRYISGISKYYSKATDIIAVPIWGSEKGVRAAYILSSGNAVFSRLNTSNTVLEITDVFGDVPLSGANNTEDKKLVVKSADTTITNSLEDRKLSTEKSANNHAVTKYTNGVIQVPYGAKTLTIDSSAFNTSNANYISALANVNGTQKYAVLGRTGENLEIDLASIVNNNQVGSKATVSFYAEQANPANTSDVVSEIPVTVEVEVVEGPEQTIRYELGGGSGNLPSNATVKAGKSYTMADGSGLIKDGNLFSCWQLTYTPYGETDEVSRLVKANEAIVVSDAANGTITATAMYSGVSSMKSTDSKSSVVTVTWDSNAPEGTTAIFTDSAGAYNDDKSIRYDKIKVAGTSVAVPGAPTLSVTTKFFDGWYDAKDGGNKVAISVSPTANITYYAHWRDGYKVTYDASGGPDASQTGKFSDGTTTDVEVVMPGAATVGPAIDEPVPADTVNYLFYGWYTEPNGSGTEFQEGTPFESLGSDRTVYAYYDLAYTFLAPSTGSVTDNPRTISGKKYSINRVKKAADSIKSGINPNSEIYNATNDLYHLYTLLKDTGGNYLDPNLTDSWAEFRIVHLGQHDDDGTSLTFQAIHMLPKAHRWDYSRNFWPYSEFLSKVQSGGEIYGQFDSNLTDLAVDVTKKDFYGEAKSKLWPPSFSELSGEDNEDTGYDKVAGSQFTYWVGKVTQNNSGNDCLANWGKRSGGDVDWKCDNGFINYSGFWRVRSSVSNLPNNYGSVSNKGVFFANSYRDYIGIVLCFGL